MDVMKVTPLKREVQNATANQIDHDREFKAHIYQQLIDLQPYLSADSQIAVLVQDEDEFTPDEEIALTLVATLGDYRVEAEGRDLDRYEAFSIAKHRMLEQLEELYASSVDTSERDAEVQELIEGRHALH